MQKQAPSTARFLLAIGFTLSCFGLLLFLWVTFGGPTPFKARAYTFTAPVKEATTLAKQADVRIGGVTVGKVENLSLPPKGNATDVEMEIDDQFAPIPKNTRAILRQKTLLGETYVELTPGDPNSGDLPDGGHLPPMQVQNSVQIDEIFAALDKPTRQAFRDWMQSSAVGIDGRGQDLNDAFGNIGPFSTDATSVLRILNSQQGDLQGLVRDTGQVFDALSARDGQLSNAIVQSNTTFKAIASRDAALAETIRIFPTFNEETRLTLNRLAKFAVDTKPLVDDLKPVADDLTPTFIAVKRLSPSLKSLFVNLGPFLTAAQRGLPALGSVLQGLKPVLVALDPFLANLNPVVRYVNAYRSTVADFFTSPPSGFSRATSLGGDPAPRRSLRVLTYLSPESLSIYPTRISTNRGNGYLQPGAINSYASAAHGIFPNFDCNPSGGETKGSGDSDAPCFVAPSFPSKFGGTQAPNIFADP